MKKRPVLPRRAKRPKPRIETMIVGFKDSLGTPTRSARMRRQRRLGKSKSPRQRTARWERCIGSLEAAHDRFVPSF